MNRPLVIDLQKVAELKSHAEARPIDSESSRLLMADDNLRVASFQRYARSMAVGYKVYFTIEDTVLGWTRCLYLQLENTSPGPVPASEPVAELMAAFGFTNDIRSDRISKRMNRILNMVAIREPLNHNAN